VLNLYAITLQKIAPLPNVRPLKAAPNTFLRDATVVVGEPSIDHGGVKAN
jgi:hypothetical protein